jgi:hypothetical protein
MSPIQRTLAVACLACAALPPALAGQVNVSFVGADEYADAGNSKSEREANLATLASHLSSLGQRLLPGDTVLEIEVLEVDLAGIVRPSRRGRGDLRIAHGGADWPRMTLRYSLVKDGQVQKADTERVADMSYTMHSSSYGASEPLHFEKRMLNDWFRTRFVEAAAAAN